MKYKCETPEGLIAEILINTNTDERGLLLKRVASILRNDAQGFTAGVIQWAAEIYDYDHKSACGDL
ncbi:hypothetical protein UFOVP138_21 [uncultured Caudovirales phage]|uniref:Uncharacterized protein n=1 Tax=uncultured Caudovirales phage TaxID=2100421 RepID=A0A6J5LEL6_9CAUD|nr:hypothetical protein UFOVP138_21 [uncultured Caudovirales phage]